ncbi:receptor-like protein EIX1 [Dioscorea cayenensis subsp. rotundata]|uniref:Receptor-like protein EIX1 n=1 Tax=Dioscorea cayennensis subsp. rotundata TaxID=55577 RepID=A0AB40CEB5_DIOCR|nr:receptor-like protein EIX1 [Dioscorea cayenensis subsp. rotundata]XP_039138229.1 receptor-like protein EIX1 [Dioscorea cayenensis subsp. rotundata]XP_039138238.1 receptor-like protein EIX1 [Dioscorea cayenensis subsp. rotundata]XP_039138247.1 receptor-like protein EIX1 [Dioscorea cayenensis subsp. rotundata]
MHHSVGHCQVGWGTLSLLRLLTFPYNSVYGSFLQLRLPSLQALYLSSTNFNGTIPYYLGQLFPELDMLDLSYNNIAVRPDWVPPPKLKYLHMNDCKVGPRFPSWLQNLKNLSSLGMSNASIGDVLPLWFWNFSLDIVDIDLSHNEIKGKLPACSLKLTNLKSLDLSHNYLEGQLPQFSSYLVDLDPAHGSFSRSTFSNTSIIVPNLWELYISSNKITGSIPSSLCELNYLQVLDLSKNMIEGVIPNCWNSLIIMDLSYNNLHGIIPASICSTFLWVLHLSNNEFFGEFPLSFQNCTSLRSLDLEHNKISGSIPAWLGENLRRLEILELRFNMLTGTIPPQLENLTYLHLIDVSNNHLSGAIPHSFGNFTAMKTNNLGRVWSGIEYYVNNIEINMKGREFQLEGRIPSLFICIDLSNNMLSGEIPEELAHLSFLQSLNLSRNQLLGQLSEKMGELRWLEVLDLSVNNLSGVIPPTMINLTSLNHLNLSYNNFYGEIPYGGQFQVLLDPSIYFGNQGLCGVPLNTKCEIEAPAQPPGLPNNEDDNNLEAIWFYLSMSLGFIFGFWAIFGALILKKKVEVCLFSIC